MISDESEWRYEAWIGGFEISFGTEIGVLGTLNIDSKVGWMFGRLGKRCSGLCGWSIVEFST